MSVEDTALIPDDVIEERRRRAAILKAIGMDRYPPEQIELAVVIAKKWDLSLELKHLVMVEGRPYITRDGLLWIAHRSGQLDGIEVTEPAIVTIPGVGDFWRAVCRVWRKDMSRPFEYAGRYPTKGGNQKYGPEMAVKVAESMALRRAFNVAVPTVDERFDLPDVQADVDAVSVPQSPPPSLSERVQERRGTTLAGEVARDSTPAPSVAPGPSETGSILDTARAILADESVVTVADLAAAADEDDETTQSLGVRRLDDARARRQAAVPRPAPAAPPADLVAGLDDELLCGDEDSSPMGLGFCELMPGHKSAHRSEHGSWPILKV